MRINKNLDDEMLLHCYKLNMKKSICVKIGYFFTLGILKLVFDWLPAVKLKCISSKCRPIDAEFILLKDKYNQYYVEKMERLNFTILDQFCDLTKKPLNLLFINKKIRYIYVTEKNHFEKLRSPFDGRSCQYFHDSVGLTEIEENERRKLYGENSIRVHVTPIHKLLYTQGLNPFYIFQLFSCTLWYLDQYYYFATCIIIISIISLIVQIKEIRETERALKNTIGLSDVCFVYRRNVEKYEEIESIYLVAGDIIKIPKHGYTMQCDAVLIKGTCIVDESMLTGESIPVTKTPILNPKFLDHPHELNFNMKEYSKNVLFSGTKVLQTRCSTDVNAVVLQTGFATSKGELVRSILYPKPVNFRFTQDSFKFLACMVFIAISGMIYTLVIMILRSEPVIKIIVRTLDLLTIVIPPALPAAMTVGIVFAQKRLRKKLIYCINPGSINVSGVIDCFCFDKTGTLTEDGLDIQLVVPSHGNCFDIEITKDNLDSCHSHIIAAMATCHTLTNIDGNIAGDPIDLILFEATNWILDDEEIKVAEHDNFALAILRPRSINLLKHHKELAFGFYLLQQFAFSSSMQRSSVIVQPINSLDFYAYVKGSPEMIKSLCDISTVPSNFNDVLRGYSERGYRVIALAFKELNISREEVPQIQRDKIECDLIFLGLVVMENRLKPETVPSIAVLNLAEIKTVMVTGDNMLTAVNVAKKAGILNACENILYISARVNSNNKLQLVSLPLTDDEYSETYNATYREDTVFLDKCDNKKTKFVITGKTWSLIYKHFPIYELQQLIVYGSVFARMAPEQKQQLIEELQKIGYYVGMCGDGANDCGALKAAHAGISLSEAEASVASPFTSKKPNIDCVLELIREGRAAVVTSYGIFKYIACYSLTQFISVCILYWAGANLTDLTFLYIDLFLLTSLAITFCYTGAYEGLAADKPKISLLSFVPIFSIIIQLIINFSFQIFVWILTINQPWFEPYVPPTTQYRNFTCHEVTAVFSISAFQYIALAIAFSKGPPYRKTMFSNYIFLLNIAILLLITSLIAIYPFQFNLFLTIMQLKPAPMIEYRIFIVNLALLNFILCLIAEMIFSDGIANKLYNAYTHRAKKSLNLYNQIMFECGNKPNFARRVNHLDLVQVIELESSIKLEENFIVDRLVT